MRGRGVTQIAIAPITTALSSCPEATTSYYYASFYCHVARTSEIRNQKKGTTDFTDDTDKILSYPCHP